MIRSLWLIVLTFCVLPAPLAQAAPPTDKQLKARLQAVRDYIESQDWKPAVENAQILLDQPTDVFIVVTVKGSDGKEVETLVGVRYAANQLVAGLPKEGRAAYAELYEKKAAELLAKARKESDKALFAEVAQRYLFTKAGSEAAERLATMLLKDGDFMAAAQAYDRLIQRDGIEKLEPITLYKAAIAFSRCNTKEDTEKKDKLWKQLAAKAPKGLTIDGKDRTLKELLEELDKQSKRKPAALFDWPMFQGAPNRNGQGVGDSPFLVPRWIAPLTPRARIVALIANKNDMNSVLQKLENNGEPVIAAFAPITATVTERRTGKTKSVVIYRDYHGIVSRDVDNAGMIRWRLDSLWSLGGPSRPDDVQDATKQTAFDQWVSGYRNAHKPGVVIENSTISALSSDGQRVYFVDDLQVPPYVPQMPLNPWVRGSPQPFYTNPTVKPAIDANTLQAVTIATGKLVWKLGVLNIKPTNANETGEYDEIEKLKLKHDFRDSYFLGAPLPLDGKLYFLNEKNQEICLVCLDTAKLPAEKVSPKELDDAIAWVQPLGTAKTKLLDDPGRRIDGAHIAYGEGILVCPLNAGVIVGVDPLTHTLLWTHSYRDEAPAAPPAPPGRPFPVPGAAPLGGEWKASAPIVQSGTVVFGLPDSSDLRCLDLRTGRLLWSNKRSDNDVYLAGVFAERVVIVGKKDVRAFSLDGGKEVWRILTRMPSGRGAAGDNIYYLPLKEAIFGDKEKGPGIFAIDIEKGKIIAQTRSKPRAEGNSKVIAVPGNLTFCDGQIISQSATEIACYPQLKAKLKQMDDSLKKDANDPRGRFERGELRREKGDLLGAIEDFRAALANQPPADLRPNLDARLFDVLTELLYRDFAAGEKYLKEYEELLRRSTEGGQLRPAEVLRRHMNLLNIKGRGYESQGKVIEALNAYLDLAALKSDNLLSPYNDPALRLSPELWARARIAALYDGADAAGRKRLDEEIAKKAAALRKDKDDAALAVFVRTFSPTFAAARPVHLELAERLIANPRKSLTEIELLLAPLIQQTQDKTTAAQALEAQEARLMVRRGLLDDGLHFYRQLARTYPKTTVRDDKKGADYLADLAADKRFLPFLETPPAGLRKWRGELTEGTFPMTALDQACTFQPLNDPLPSLKRMRFAMNGYSLRLTERPSQQLRMAEMIRGNITPFLSPQPKVDPPFIPALKVPLTNRFGYHSVGHLAVVNVGQWLVGIDTATSSPPRVLWEVNLLSNSSPPGTFVYNANDEILSLLGLDNSLMTVAMSGPVTASAVCILTRDGLSALDPLIGKPLWTRNDVSPRSRLFGDDEYVFVVEMNGANNTPSATRAFRLQDGKPVAVPNFAALYQKKVRTHGHNLLSAHQRADGLTLRLYDVMTGKDIFSQDFKRGTVILNSEDRDLAGIIDPDGRATIISLSQCKAVAIPGLMPEHLKNLKEAHLLADAQTIYIALHTMTDFTKKEHPALATDPWENVPNNVGLRSITVNGAVYAFVRSSSKLRWYNEVSHQKLSLEDWRDMPILLFTARWQDNMNNLWMARNLNQAIGNVYIEAYDKMTGRMFYNNQPGDKADLIYSIVFDPRKGSIDLKAVSYKVTLTSAAPK